MAMDIKKAAAEHVEKGVFGLVVLVMLLALVGTNWRPYEGTPQQIVDKIREGKKNLYANTWPEDEQAKYAITDEVKPSAVLDSRLLSKRSPAGLEFLVPFVRDPAGTEDPVTEPTLLKPMEAIATSEKVFIQLAAKKPEAESTEGDPALAAAEAPKEDDDTPDEFRTRSSNALNRGPAGMEMAGLASYQDYAVELYDSSYTDPGMMEPGMQGYDGLMSGGTMASMPKRDGLGYHFVSVRAVFPLHDQIRKFADAIHRPIHEAARSFEIIDFELERQTMNPGADPWSGEWEPVDLQVAADVLEKADGFEPDVVNSVVTDSVITMPLPMRISGVWKKHATHPKIEKFELSPEQIAVEMEMQKRMLTELVAQKKTIDESAVKRGGFSKFVFDNRQMQSALMDSESMYAMEFAGSGMGGGMGMGTTSRGGRPPARPGAPRGLSPNDPREKLVAQLAKDPNDKEQEKMIRDWIQQQASVEGELLLFRYLDFDVEPGKTYRYRVRFVLNNPNFGKRIAEAGGVPHVVEGETRVTDWSDPTAPVVVVPEVRYFLTDIREQSGRVLPSARMDVFQWDRTHGTSMNQSFEVRIGQNIAEEVETLVIDPAQVIHEKQKYKFSSKDYLVDALEDIVIQPDFHDGEKVEARYRVKLAGSNGRMNLPVQALVNKREGRLAALGPAGESAEYARAKKYEADEEKFFEYLKQPDKSTLAAGSEYAGLMGPGYEDMMMSDMGMMGMGGRGRNVLRRGGGAGASSGSSSSARSSREMPNMNSGPSSGSSAPSSRRGMTPPMSRP